MEKICICGKVFTKPINESLKNWNNRHKYCSRRCRDKNKNNEHLVKHMFKKGEHHSPLTEFKSGENTGDKNNLWKGDDVGYAGIHMWALSHFGRIQECEICKSTDKKRYHWHNISKKYLRDRDDWIRLCPSCHKKVHLSSL